jgi:HlyD family secretion protein
MRVTFGRWRLSAIALAITATAVFPACSRTGPKTYQGYVEGEFVHVAAGTGGRLERLFVQRGQTIAANVPLFELEAKQEAAAVRQADETLAATRAQLADLKTGKRSPEIAVLSAQYDQAVASEKQSASRVERDLAQLEAGGISRAQLDESRTKHEMDAARVRELRGQLDVAVLPGRPQQIQAQSSQVAAARAAVDEARSRLDQKHVTTDQAGLVVDTLFREGEWVPAGSPAVRLLPPANIKIRFFVPQASVPLFPIGRKVRIRCDGCAADIDATISYVSAEPEFTPPIIYSNETRAKLVFMIEARPAAESALVIRPGQPVEVVPQ